MTLPSDIREALDIQEGDLVEFSIVGVVRKQQAADAPANRPEANPVGGA